MLGFLVLDLVLIVAMVKFLKNCALIELPADNKNQYVLCGVFLVFAVISLVRFSGILKIIEVAVMGVCALLSSQLSSGLYKDGIIILGRNYLKKDISRIAVEFNAYGCGINFKTKTGYKSLLLKQDDDDVKRYLKKNKFPDESIL